MINFINYNKNLIIAIIYTFIIIGLIVWLKGWYMIKKYKLTKENKIVNGIKFYRIKALKSFGVVKKGELGGFIQSDKNLSQDGDAWAVWPAP